MSLTTVYCYYLDDAFKKAIKLNSASEEDQGYGVLDSEARSYFYDATVLYDVRSTRLSLLDNKAPYGDNSLIFDGHQLPELLFDDVNDLTLQRILNIAERCAYQQTITDSAIDYQLRSNNAYEGYVPESFMRSVGAGEVMATCGDKTCRSINIYDWFSFEFTLKDDVTVKFHVWLSNARFKEDYPYTTISAVVPPCSLDLLTNPGALVSTLNIDMLQMTSSFIFGQSQDIAKLIRDHSGVYSFTTKYVIDANRSIQIAFALPYCGPKAPTSMECRKAIREYLELKGELTEDNLKILFPELYISARFYIVPLWDYYHQFVDGTVYTSINSLYKYMNYMNDVFFDVDDEFKYQYCEILENGHTKMPSLSLPDTLNNKHFSIRELHPTYQDHSTLSVGWRYMTAATQEFAGKFMRCLKVLNGESTSAEFITVDLDGIKYLSFTSGDAEYLVMFKDSFLYLVSED